MTKKGTNANGAQELDARELTAAAALLANQRWTSMATLDANQAPLSSMVACATLAEDSSIVLHLSRLAEHTENILARPILALIFAETDDGRRDPQTLARLFLKGKALVVTPDEGGYATLRNAYLQRFPSAAQRFSFADFLLFRFQPISGSYVAGFGRAWPLDETALDGLWRTVQDADNKRSSIRP